MLVDGNLLSNNHEANKMAISPQMPYLLASINLPHLSVS